MGGVLEGIVWESIGNLCLLKLAYISAPATYFIHTRATKFTTFTFPHSHNHTNKPDDSIISITRKRKEGATLSRRRREEEEKNANTARDGGMPVALAGAMAAAKAAIPGAKIAAKRARKGQATTVRAKKRVGAAPSRSAQAALEASSRQVEANRGPVCPRAPIGDRTCGLRVDRGVPSLLRYPTVARWARK